MGVPLRKIHTVYVRPAKELAVSAKADRPEYRPGGKAKIAFALTDSKGKPAPGALSLSAVDEAVFEVVRDRPGLEKTFYLLEQELLKPVYRIYPWAPDDGKGGADRRLLEQALFAHTAQPVAGAGD